VNISKPFILRPVATTMVMLGVMLVGMLSFKRLPVSALPQVEYPTLQVQAFYPGASPEVVASTITSPLEKQLGQIAGLQQMSSSSSLGASSITLQFVLDLNIDIAEQQVQAAINAAASYLPSNLPTPPTYSKRNPADAPIMTLALTSSTLPLTAVEDLADTRMAQKISQLPGVGMVSLNGGQKPSIHIRVNPTALSSYGISMEDLRSALTLASVNQAKGSFDGASLAHTILANDQLMSLDEFRKLVVVWRNNAPVRISDIAEVSEEPENTRQKSWMNEQPAIVLGIHRQPGANTIAVVDRIKALLPQLQGGLPASVDVRVLSDRTTTIRASIQAVEHELLLTIALVVMVIFLFLRNLPATLIPSLSVPLSLVGTFTAMYWLDFSLNNLTLMALTIATGFVVDDAIVMLENIMRYIEKGMSPLEAALKGSGEIGFTILSLTASLIAVLIPLLLMGDVLGRLFREFAVTLSVAILVSAFVSLTLTPMLCAHLPNHRVAPSDGAEHGMDFLHKLVEAYGRSLKWVLARSNQTIVVAVAMLALTAFLLWMVPKGFFPIQDTGMLLGFTEADQSIAYDAMVSRQDDLNRLILHDPAVESLSSFVGVDGTNTALNNGRIQINLKSLAEREDAVSVIKRLQAASDAVKGIRLYLQPVQDLSIEDRLSRTQFQLTLESADPSVLDEWTPRVLEKLNALPQLRDVAGDLQNNARITRLVIDRDSASRLGITPQMIDDNLYDAFGQRQIITRFTQINQYRVILEVGKRFQRNPESLDQIFIPVNGGRVPLSGFTRREEHNGPLVINRQGQFPVVTLSFNLAPKAALGDAVDQIQAVIDDLDLPASLRVRFQGTAKAFQGALDSQLPLLLAAVVTVYLVLGVLYESYVHPVTILSTLPSAAVGALLMLLLFGADLDIVALIGIVLLIGIVEKNAIMMIDFALDAQRNDGLSPQEAIFQACLLRFRPIMMTTMAALLAGIPLALGSGMGQEMRRPLGIVIVGGLVFSQLMTLYTTPAIYLGFDRLAKRLGTHWTK
jgi:multidrug efflux pump